MSKIVNITDAIGAPNTRSFKEIRAEFDLSRTQAAEALGMSRASIDHWERKKYTARNEVELKEKFQAYIDIHDGAPKGGRNLVFNKFPLRMAREILEKSVAEMAEKYGYSESAWAKFEGNGRPLKAEIKEQLERDVRAAFMESCSF